MPSPNRDLRWEADAAFLLQDQQVRTGFLKSGEPETHRVDRAFTPPPGKGPSDKGSHRPFDPGSAVKIELIEALTAQQRQRLHQISLQIRTPMVFAEPEVLEPLNLYPLRRQIRQILVEEFGGFGPPRPGGPKPLPGPDKDAKVTGAGAAFWNCSVARNSREAWRALIGAKPYTPNR